ncbi:glucose 1-dehydrogenase [Alkalicella caledoniensis]|uniref:Glucose 1-dehydrogenase n=1 Tax=Alkalicella caledoniensis TaxID=2731377 RepID=A0A7G9W9D2_ALKCA|nr:glucose 1-dehydrogenase [Alkalicella caledoniensis]QNO15294.1 glucose 1-dehydrogenase [Alkalicella caledoniensis]
MEFKNKVVIITGAGKGIGKAIAQGFAQKGAKVIIAEIDTENGQGLEQQLTSQGLIAKFVHTDAGNSKSIQDMVSDTMKEYGQIDILINNAAISHNSSLWVRDDQDWERVIAVNLSGPYYAAKYASKHMAKNSSGNIINISSTRAFMSEAKTEPYSSSKGGIDTLTHSLAVSLGEYGIRVNSIAPGWIHTGDEANLTKEDNKQHPTGRVGTVQDIVEACYYLASEKSSFMTGQNITIDGGMTKKMIYI